MSNEHREAIAKLAGEDLYETIDTLEIMLSARKECEKVLQQEHAIRRF